MRTVRSGSARARSRSRLVPTPTRVVATPEAWLGSLVAERRSPETLRAYERDLNQFTEWYARTNEERFRVERLAGIDVRDYIQGLIKAGRPPASVNRLLASLRHYSRWAHEHGAVTDATLFEIRKVKFVKASRHAPRSLTTPQIRKLLKELEHRGSPRDTAVLYLLLFAGLRVSEAAGARREDLALSPRKGVLRVRAAVAKGGKERTVPVPLAARERIAHYLETRTDDDPALFVGQRGPLRAAALRRIVYFYAAAAHLHASPHVLRHNFARAYLDANQNDLVGLADLLGHESLNTTRVYTRRRLDDLAEASERVSFGGPNLSSPTPAQVKEENVLRIRFGLFGGRP